MHTHNTHTHTHTHTHIHTHSTHIHTHSTHIHTHVPSFARRNMSIPNTKPRSNDIVCFRVNTAAGWKVKGHQ